MTGIIVPGSALITGKNLQAGDHIIGVASSGLHANGVSLVIKKTLARCNGNARQAAEELGLSRSAFYRRLEKYGL